MKFWSLTMPQSMPGGRQMEPPMVESIGEQSSKEEKSYKSKGTNNIDENIALKGIIVDEDEIRRRRKRFSVLGWVNLKLWEFLNFKNFKY